MHYPLPFHFSERTYQEFPIFRILHPQTVIQHEY
jgi:hypothetical protein